MRSTKIRHKNNPNPHKKIKIYPPYHLCVVWRIFVFVITAPPAAELFVLYCFFFAHNCVKHKADNQHCNCYAHPAETEVVKWERTACCADKAKGNTDAVNCVDNADNRCTENCERIDKAVAFDKSVAEAKHDKHNGNRINCIENRHGNAENCVEALITDCKGEDCDAKYKFVVADAFEKS